MSEFAMTLVSHKDFVEKVLREGYECEEFGKVLAHICYKE